MHYIMKVCFLWWIIDFVVVYYILSLITLPLIYLNQDVLNKFVAILGYLALILIVAVIKIIDKLFCNKKIQKNTLDALFRKIYAGYINIYLFSNVYWVYACYYGQIVFLVNIYNYVSDFWLICSLLWYCKPLRERMVVFQEVQ